MEIMGKMALVTGGAKRIGRAIAMGLAQKGANIVLHYRRSKDEAVQTQSEIAGLGVDCRVFRANLSSTNDTLGLAEEIGRNQLNIDILINSASVFYKTPIVTTTESDWDLLVDTNLKNYYFLSRAIGLRMKRKGHGKIINIADWSGFRPYKDYTPYCTSKGGLITLTKALARDLAPEVSVNAVAPGPVLPPPDMTDEEINKIASTTALGRWGKPQDIANAVVFLLENDYINGTVLVVDGGRSIV